jgi:hypothetical protein
MAAKEWYQVRPGPSVMVEFSNNDAKILTSNSVFEELPTNKCIIRLLRGKRPRLRKMGPSEIEVSEDNDEDIVVVLPDEVVS